MEKVMAWIEKNGGAEGMKKRNEAKASLFYDYLAASTYYHATTDKDSRSLMNIPFLTKETDPETAKKINDAFVKGAAEAGLVNLAGHRLVGGMRASIYNAMPVEGVQKLINYMEQFARENA
jgi:phosphoserine aminotransferase